MYCKKSHEKELLSMKQNKVIPQKRYHNIKEMLDHVCWEYAQKPAFLYKQGTKYRPISYSRLRSDIRSLGAALLHRGLGGKKILLIGENCYPWCLTYLTALCGLGVIIPVDKKTPSDDLCDIAKISGAAAIIYSKKYQEKADALPKKLQKFSFEEIFELCDRAMTFSDKELHDFDLQSIEIDSVATLIFTAGTTGISKGVMISQRNICSTLESLTRAFPEESGGTSLAILPLHYIYESIAGMLFPLSRGGAIAFPESIHSVMQNSKDVSPTNIVCVPSVIEKIYRKIRANIKKRGIEEKVDKLIKTSNSIKIPALKAKAKKKIFAEIHSAFGGELEYFMISGGPIDPEVITGMKDFGFNIVRAYGLAECTSFVTLTPYSEQKNNTDGKPLTTGELKIVDPDPQGVGEIFYRGDNVMLGYYKHEELNKEIKQNGWIQTGDMGILDENGNLTVLGRKKNAICASGGKMVFPEELEPLLSRSPYVKECAIIGIKLDSKKSTDITAVVFPDYTYSRELLGVYSSRPMVKEKLTSAINELNASLPTYKKITRLVLLDEEIPKNEYKKIIRQSLPEYVIREYIELGR